MPGRTPTFAAPPLISEQLMVTAVSDLCLQSLYPADIGGSATLSPDGRGPPRPEGSDTPESTWICSVISFDFTLARLNQIFVFSAGEFAPGLQVERSCGETGGFRPRHRGGGRPAGLVW